MPRRTPIVVFLVLVLAILPLLSCGDDGGVAGKVKTIVLITVDTLRRDYVSAYAPDSVDLPQPVTKAFDALAAGGLRFDDARTPVPLTLPAHTTMLSGLPPAATGVRLNTYGRLAPPESRGFPLLAESLAADGWHTAAFVSADALNARYGLDQGFAHYDGDMPNDPRRPAVQLAERRGDETVAAALRHVRGVDGAKKLFLWVHLFEPHAPYAADGTYAGDVDEASRVVGRLLKGLDKAGRRQGAAILLTSDHGEALGELRERSHGFLLADGVLRVPFMLTAPGLEPGVRSDPAEVADVAPTLAGLAGVSWKTMDGPGCGLDLMSANAPADRPRPAESLYGHHLHRWAQLVAASSDKGTLVDAGRDRLHWVPRSGYQRWIPSTSIVKDSPDIRRLAKSLADYKQFEQPGRMQGGQVAAGYGGGGVVEGFLPPAENARLADPHINMPHQYRLDDIKQAILARPLPRALRAALGALEALNKPNLEADSPSLHFWIGEATMRLAAAEPARAKKLLPQAEKAYIKAFELGRKDTQTLARACGVNAVGNEQACLDRLEKLVKQVPQPSCQYWILKIRLLKDLGDLEGAEAAWKAADALCRDGKFAKIWSTTCR